MTTTKLTNPSGLRPLGRAVLCIPYDPEFSNTTIAIPDHVRAHQLMSEVRAIVLELGANVWPNEPPRAVVGDKVLISKFSGSIVKGTADGKLYRLCNCDDLYCGIEVGELKDVVVEDPLIKDKQTQQLLTAASGRR